MRSCLVGALVFLSVAGSSSAATLSVPSQYASINLAMDAALPGDVVLVAPGTYDGGAGGEGSTCITLAPGVTLRSEGGPAVTFLEPVAAASDASRQCSSEQFVLIDSAAGEIDGFTFGNQSNYLGPSVRVDQGDAVIRDCVFRDQETITDVAAAVEATGSNLSIVECTFVGSIGNSIRMDGGDLTIESSEFSDAVSGSPIHYDAVAGSPATITVLDSRFLRNGGGAAYFSLIRGSTRFRGCLFEENAPTSNVTTALFLSTNVGSFGVEHVVEECVFRENHGAAGAGGWGFPALRVRAATGSVRNCTFHGNDDANPGGEGVAVHFFGPGGTWDFTHNIVSSTEPRVAVTSSGFSGLTVSGGCNVFWNNPGGNTTLVTDDGTSVEADPLYCAPEVGDLTISSASPANSATCGLIGALGVGCGATAIETSSWGRLKAAYADR